MRGNFVFSLFVVGFAVISAIIEYEPGQEMVVPQITSLTMCLARVSYLKDAYTISNNSMVTDREPITNTTEERCPFTTRMYRTADGECNNPKFPNKGRSLERYKRFIPAQYDDKISIPRIRGNCKKDVMFGCTYGKLPSPRLVSTEVHLPTPKDSSSIFTLLLMQWGQFVNHETTAAAIDQPGDLYACCDNPRAAAGFLHPDTFERDGKCFTIPLFRTTKDRFFDTKCMNFIRSRPVDPDFSIKNPREQQNLNTAYFDASVVYGSDKETQDSLRDKHGKMKTSAGGRLLPRGSDSDCILDNAPYCFAAGDDRLHVFPTLTLIHTLFVRVHNYIAHNFKLHTKMDDETIFQETRKIIAALIQKITYKHYIREILNKETRKRFFLDAPYRYDHKIDTNLANSFAAAALRFGHSQIPDYLVINGTKVLTRKLFNDPQYIFFSFNKVVDNLLTNEAEAVDKYITKEVTDHLFENGNVSFDLASFNIQRGRDHGLPPYNDFREWCKLPRLESFFDRIFGKTGKKLHALYEHVDDLDLFTGLISEKPDPYLGPTLSCILGRQFYDQKNGDSFWYETKDRKKGFTKKQLKAIQKVEFSAILCKQFGRKYIQKNPFRVVSKGNPLVKCDSLDPFDLTPWLPEHKV